MVAEVGFNMNTTSTDNSMTPASSTESLGSFPRAVLECRPNSHPFQERSLVLNQAVKIGRSVARARPGGTNAIFDCKVLSRNHALVWYESGKFFLQDTKSSNGTFVNNQRLSKGSEESLPREVCSGDILQFGVDVMENSRQVTHGCIIATLKLFLPDGKEAKASPTIMNSSMGGNLPPQDLYLLNQYIQEALAREQLLETKLSVLQRLVGQTEIASNNAWKSLIDEDRLLTKVEILESQLSAYSKNMTEDKLMEETKRLLQEKEAYNNTFKETLQKISTEKLDIVKQSQELQKQLDATRDELSVLNGLREQEGEINKKLAKEVDVLSGQLYEAKTTLESLQEKEVVKEEANAKDDDIVSEGKCDKNADETQLQERDLQFDTEIKIEKEQEEILTKPEPDIKIAENTISAEVDKEDMKLLQEKYTQLQEENLMLARQLSLEKKKETSENLESTNNNSNVASPGVEEGALGESSISDYEPENSSAEELQNLSTSLEQVEHEKLLLQKEIEELKQNQTSQENSRKLEDKIGQLLKYKEKCAEILVEKSQLELNISLLEEDVEALSMQSRTATAFSLIPLAILFVSVIIACLPFLSNLFGTVDTL